MQLLRIDACGCRQRRRRSPIGMPGSWRLIEVRAALDGTGLPRARELPLPLGVGGAPGGGWPRARGRATVRAMATDDGACDGAAQGAGQGTVRMPAWWTGGGKPLRLSCRERRPRVVHEDAPGSTIDAVRAALRAGRRSRFGGPAAAGARALGWSLVRAGIRPSAIPAAVRIPDCRNRDTRRLALARWAERVTGRPWGLRSLVRGWRKHRPQDFQPRRRNVS